MYFIISIRYSEILADYECQDGFKKRVTFSHGNQAFNSINRCLLVPDKLEDDFSCRDKRNNQEGEPTIDD